MSRFLDMIQPLPLADGINWVHGGVFRYESTLLGAVIESPMGRLTDFTSAPQSIWSFVPPWGRHGPASAVHDEGYWSQTHTREQIDDVLREAMELLGVAPALAAKIYLGVRAFGQHAWDMNARLKASGFPRLVSVPIQSNPPYAAAI
jgi:hypothetical protein